MQTVKLLMLLVLFSSDVLANVTSSNSANPDIHNPIQVKAFVDGIVLPLMKKNHSPSGVVTLMKNDKVIFSNGYGFQDIEQQILVDAESTIFRIGSISKLFTWVAVMQQVEKGNLDLDTNVNEYLKQFQLEDSWPGQPVTMRHIMSHTAGFEDGGLGYLLVSDVEQIVPLAESLFRYMPARVNPPGEHTAYSNWATALAGLIVANVSGVEFNQYVKQNIFDVLEMDSATFEEPIPSNLVEQVAKPYRWEAGRYIEDEPEIIANLGPSGSVSASSNDMVKFAKAILGLGKIINSKGNVVRILDESTTELMLSRLHGHDLRTLGMAYGFVELPYVNRSIIGHNGGTNMFLSHFGLSLDEDMMLFSSFSGPGAMSVHQSFVGAFYSYFFPTKLNNTSPVNSFHERAHNFVGTYHPWRANFTNIEKILGTFQSVNITLEEDNTLLVEGTRFVEIENNLFREVDGDQRIVFQEGDSNVITGYIRDGAAVKQMFKTTFFNTLQFLLLVCISGMIVFVLTILRYVYQRKDINLYEKDERLAVYSSVALATSNLLFLILFSLSLLGLSNKQLMTEVPLLLKISLIFPLCSVVAFFCQVIQTKNLWYSNSVSLSARIRHSVVTVCGGGMIWIYYQWNFIGFNYLP